MAWLLRFVQFVKDKQNAKTGRLTVDDFDAATAAIVRIVQGLAYTQEIKDLRSNGAVKPSSKVVSLNPKLDEGGFLRVNGRGQLKPTSCTVGQQMIFPETIRSPSGLFVTFTTLLVTWDASMLLQSCGKIFGSLKCLYWLDRS